MAKFTSEDFDNALDLSGEAEWMDTPKGMAKVSNELVGNILGVMDDSIIGDALRIAKGKPTRREVEDVTSPLSPLSRLTSQAEKNRIAKAYLEANTILQQGQQKLKEGADYWQQQKSAKAKAQDKLANDAVGALDTLEVYAQNPSYTLREVVSQAPQLVPMILGARGLSSKLGNKLTDKLGVDNRGAIALAGVGYQPAVGGQQAREQSLQDSKDVRDYNAEEELAFNEDRDPDPSKVDKNSGAASRYQAARIAADSGATTSALAGLIGLKGDAALTNLLLGQSIKGLSGTGLKAAGKHLLANTVEEAVDEAGSPLGANIGASNTYEPSRDLTQGVGKSAVQGGVIGAGMGSVQAGSLAIFGDNQNTNNQNNLAQAIINTIPKQDIPKQYQNAFNAFEDAKQAEAQAQAAYEANPTPESEDALAQATDARLKANNQFSQYDAAFKQTFTEQEQQDLLANDLKGIAARAKLAEEAKQAELNSKAEQDALAKAQRANMVKGLSAFADNEEVLLNEVNQLGLDDTQKELLLREVFAERKNAKAKPQQANGQPKTPLELAVDEHFDAKGNRKPNVMSPDIADKHKVSLDELLSAIAKRNNDIKIQIAEQQQLENTLAELAAENDTSSMLAMLEGYDKAEADRLFNNAFKTVETRAKEAEKAVKAKEAEATKQAQAKQKQSAFSADMSALYESNPNATYSDWKAIGKKHGITSAIDLANAWASAKSNKPKQKSTETLALPSPNTIMVTDAQGNTTKTTENNVPKKQRNADISVPSGLNVDVSNAANTQRDRGVGSYIGDAYIVRQDGKPFPTEQVAQQALTNKTTNKTKAKKNEPVISKDTHTVVPVEGGYAIAPVEDIKQEPVSETKVEQPIVDDLSGEYAHSQFPDATATVTKTDKGYDIDWGDEVQSFTGKNALEKTKSILAKEGFNKGKPKDDGDGGVTIEPMPKKPVSPTNTTGEQIAQAMDKTAQAITEAAHNKVVERVKNGEEIVYKQPAAIERVKQDERYQVEINDKGHAVVKNVKDNDGNWVKQDKPFSAPSKNSPETTIMRFLNDGELENAYFFAENQDKPIKFTLSNRKNPIAYFLTEPVDLGNNITGFVGIEANPMSKSKRWLVIEEKSRTSISFEEISKQAAIRSAKARLSSLKKEDLESFASKITPINKTDEEMKADWLAKNNIKIDEQFNEENSINRKTENLAPAEKAQQVKKEPQKAEQPKQDKPTKKESLLIKIDDELDAALDDFAAIFKEQGKRLSSGVDPVIMGKVLAIGMKASTLYLAKGAVKFAVWAENIIAALSSKGVPQDAVQPYLKGLYAASKMQVSPEIRQQMDKEDDVYDFDFATLNVTPTPKAEAVHIEDGKAEEVTPEIIRESLAKVDDKPINGLTMSLKQGKQWLLNEANTALANAKEEEKAAEAKRVLAVAKAKEELAVAEKALEEKKARNALLVNQNSKADADEELKLRNDLYDKKMAVIHAGEKVEPEHDYVTFKVPNDGSFKVLKTVSALESFIKKVKANRGFDKQSPKKLFPAVPQNSVDTTIAEFLGDGEVENAYEFAKLQDRPIRFGVGNSQGRERANAYALTEPVDLGGGFKGFVGLSLDTTKKQWIFIEENTRLSIGLFDDTKDKAIKNAKDKLAGLSESDKAKMLVKAKETKIKKTDAELEQQWLSQIGYNPNQNEDEAKAELKAKNEQKQKNAENLAKTEGDKSLKALNDESNTKPSSIIKVDFPLEETVNAWQHSIRNPSGVAKSFKQTYEDYIKRAYDIALPLAENNAQREALEQASLKLQQDYIQKFKELNSARSGVTSSFIAGRNNFNGKQAESRGNAFDKVSESFDKWTTSKEDSLKLAVIAARSPEQLAKIKAEKDAKEQKLQDKNDEFLRKVLDFKKGDDFTIGKNQYKVVRVNRNKDGMPISLTLEGKGLIKGIDDKISLFGRGMAYPTINDLREAVTRVQKKDESELIPKKSDNEDLAPVEKAQQAKKDAFLNTEIDSQYGKVTKRQLIDNLINDGWTLTTGWTEDKAKGKALDAEFERLKRTAPIGNSSHPDTVRLNELKNLAKESPHKERGQFFFKETTYRLESPTGQLKQLSKTELDYVNEVLANKEPQPVAVEQEPTKTEEKPAEKPSISDKQANREKIRITMLQATNREKALALAVKLTEEMPDMDYEITSELQSVIQHNKWLGIEIKMPKTPFKGDSDAEVKKSIKQLQKAFDGTGYSFNLIGLDKNSVMGQLSFSKDFSTRLNYIRNSKDIWVLFDNNYSNAGSLEFLDPVAKAITKWLNGENLEPFMAGIDPNWDIQFRSIPRVIADKLSAAKEKGENSTSKASTLTESKTINDSKKEDSIQPTSKTPLPDNSFMDKSLPVNTGVNARMVVIDKQESNNQDAESIIDVKQKTVTQEQIAKYNEIRATSGDKTAQEILRAEMDALGFNSTERMHAWDALKAQSYQEQKDAVAAEKAAKKAAKAAKPSIKQIAESIIAKSYLFNQREQQFLNDIKTKRKLTDKQESWLRALAQKADVEIIGDFDNRKSKYENTNISFEDYVEDFLDMSVGLMSQQQKEDAYKTYQSWLDGSKPKFGQSSAIGDRTITQVREKLVKHFGEKIISLLEKKGILKIHQSLSDESVPNSVKNGGSNTDGAYDEGAIHLIADNLTDETIIPTFVHELGGHKGFQEMMSPKAYELIMQQFYRLVAQGNSIAIKAKQRAERAEVLTDKEKVGKTDKQIKELEAIYRMRQQDEYIPYLITEQAKNEQATPQERNAVKRLIDHIVRAIKGWVVRTLSKYNATAGIGKRVSETLDARDIQLMAERMIKDIAEYEGYNNRFNKQSVVTRRDFLTWLGVGATTAAVGGGITLFDKQIKSIQKADATQKVSDLSQQVFDKLNEQISKSQAFIDLINKTSKAKPSSVGKASAQDGFYAIAATAQMELMNDIRNNNGDVIKTNMYDKLTGDFFTVNKDDAIAESKKLQKALNDNEAAIVSVVNDAIAFVESITGYTFKQLKIRAIGDNPAINALFMRQLGLDSNFDLNAKVEDDSKTTVQIHAQTLANLVSPNKKYMLHAFQTLAHELAHVMQNQQSSSLVTPLGINIEMPTLLNNMIKNILSSGYEGSPYLKSELEGFNIGYTATKALLAKRGEPLSAISKDEIINLITASIDASVTNADEGVDAFIRKTDFGNSAQFSKTEQAQFDKLLAKADKMIAEQGKLLAPNGKPSKLNRVQWAQVRTDNFKNWFGDWENDPENASKVVDENGEPKVVYHGTNADFNEFEPTKPNFYQETEGWYFFTDKRESAHMFGRKVMPVFLNISNPTIETQGTFKTWNLYDDEGNYGFIAPNTDTGNGGIANQYVVENPTQIKSATDNNGEFSPTNPDIRFSRAEENSNSIEPTQESDNKKLNSLLHGWLGGKGEKTYEAVSSSVRGFLSRMPSSMALVNNAPPAFKQMMREMIRDSKQAELTVSDILKNSTSLKAEERTLLSDYLEKELALGITPPEDVVKVGAAMRMALSYQTDELVRLGMLSTESAARWRDTYLPRMYKEKKKDPITQAIVKRFDIKGEHLKGRGQFKEVDSSEVANYLELGWEDRGVSSKGKTIVWKDYTKEEREKMGEIRDAMLRFATGFLSTQRDIAVAKLFEKIAANEELASSEPVAGWVQIPKAFIQQTGGLMRYGKLSGMWVHPDVWENTKHYIQDRGDIERIYRKTLSIWKEGKTALNVVAHTNNIVSNVVMVTAAGANINDIRKGFDSLSNKDKYYKEAVEMGMMATGHYTGDIRDYFGDDLLGATTPTNFVFKALKKAWENPVFNKMREFYDLEDQMFRLTLYRKAREYGATQQQAVDYAETFIFNYADLPVGVKKIRDFGLPFISYTYKAVPAMTRLAFTQPHRMLAITGAAYGINALAYALLGLDGDDEDKERASMPDYMQGRSAWGIPKLVRLPFGDTENPVFLDVYRWLPLGDFFSMNDRTGGVPIPTSAVFSGPYWNAYNTLIANRNGLTGGDYFEDTDSDKQTFIKSMRFGLSEWIPMYYHLDKNLNAITREFSDTPMSNLLNTMGYSGTDARGEPADLLYSSLGAIGIKARKFDVLAEQEKRYDEYDYKIKALRREMRSIARDMSNTHQERDIEDKLKEIERLLNERDEMVKSLE